MSDEKKKVEDLKKMLAGKKKTGESPEELDAAQKQLADAQEEAKKNYDQLLRVMAEFENYKKRVARDHEERVKYSHETLVKELLPVLDDFDRVLEHLPAESSPEIQSLVDGVQLIHRHFQKALKKFSLEEVPAEKEKFDPHLHEAIASVESGDAEPGNIVQCHRKGYKLHGRLIRPASVTVAKEKG